MWRDDLAMCKINILGILFIVYLLDLPGFGLGSGFLEVKKSRINGSFQHVKVPPLSHISNISNDEPTTTMTLPLHTEKQKKGSSCHQHV